MRRRGISPIPARLSFNIGFFHSMTTELAYVLGWIASDGCISTGDVTISLQVSHRPILESIKRLTGFVGAIHNTSHYDTRTLKTYHRAVLSLHSKALVELATYGLGPRKSLTLEYPDLPKNMQANFVRGFFDGDGCISKMAPPRTSYRISFCGPRPFLKSLRAVINAQNDINSGSISRNGKIAVLAYNGRHSAERILHWMYEGSTLDTRLARKYSKYLLALEDGRRRDGKA